MKRVYFLGAGALKPFGYPITSDLFPLILKELKLGSLYVDDEDFPNARRDMREFKSSLKKLFPGALVCKELPLVTHMLSIVDQLILMGNAACPDFSLEQLTRFRKLLTRAILGVLDLPDDEEQWEQSQPLLTKFSSWLIKAKSKHKMDISIVTTNYDIVLEEKLYERIKKSHTELDFGLSWRDPRSDKVSIVHRPPNPKLSIFKLHGSINWLRCPLCDCLYINTFGSIYLQAFRKVTDDYNTCWCGYGPLQTLIVAPSIIRDIRDTHLSSIWQSALEDLRIADEWVIIGYSLPIEDIAIRSILLRAYRGRKNSPKITVVSERKNPEIENRYKFLFPKCSFLSEGFEGYVNSFSAG